MRSRNPWTLSTLFSPPKQKRKKNSGWEKGRQRGKVTKIEEARSVRPRNHRARGAAVAAQATQTKAQAAGGDPDAAAAAAAWVCPQPGTRRQRRRRTWQVQRRRSPGGRAPSELPGGSPRWLPRATRPPRSRVSQLSCKVVEPTPPQRSRPHEDEEEARRSRRRPKRRRRRGAERLRPLPGALACNPAASGRRRPPPVTSRPLPPLPAPRRARGPAAETARRAPRPHWPRPRRRATPTCQEPMGARLASPSAFAARPRCSFENPHTRLPAAPSQAPRAAVVPVAAVAREGKGSGKESRGGNQRLKQNQKAKEKVVMICPRRSLSGREGGHRKGKGICSAYL